jgi:hypothetical protein
MPSSTPARAAGQAEVVAADSSRPGPPRRARQADDDVRRNPGQNRNALYEMESHQVSRSGSIVTLRRTGPVKRRKGFMPFGI